MLCGWLIFMAIDMYFPWRDGSAATRVAATDIAVKRGREDQRVSSAWNISFDKIDPPHNPGALTDVVPLVDRLVDACGTKSTSQFLDVELHTVENWRSRRESITLDLAKRILDLHAVLMRVLLLYPPRAAMAWLAGSEPHLNFARPVDVLVARGAGPLIEALDRIASGGSS